MTGDLEKLVQWLKEQGIRHVAMESSGIYWIPVFNVLEEELNPQELLVVNAQHIKAVPGRKTDVNGRTSSWARWPPRSMESPAGRCWGRSSGAIRTQWRWPAWGEAV